MMERRAAARLKHADLSILVRIDSLTAALQAHRAFLTKWSKAAPKVAASSQEAGDELLTCYRFPHAEWKLLRTTNAIGCLHGELRRRVKTQGPPPSASRGVAPLCLGHKQADPHAPD